MASKPSNWKCCATCQNWSGHRRASTFRNMAEYRSDSDKGECVGGGWNRVEKRADSSCQDWDKWSVLD